MVTLHSSPLPSSSGAFQPPGTFCERRVKPRLRNGNVRGSLGGAPPDAISREGALLTEFFEGLVGAGLVKGPPRTEMSFDEFNLDLDLWYEGTLIELPVTHPPTPDELLSGATAVARLSAFLVSRSADGAMSELQDGRCHVRFHLEH